MVWDCLLSIIVWSGLRTNYYIWLVETTCRYMHEHTCTNAIDRCYNVIGGKAGLLAVISARISTGKLRDIGTKAQPER